MASHGARAQHQVESDSSTRNRESAAFGAAFPVVPGHALLGAQFTATSMIGMIALAGIIVRNSILLVDFIDSEVRAGRTLEDAVVRAGAIRARPIALTALAAMIGALFILDDPIFNGLAVSLIFGILVSTVLTLLVIPVLYYAYLKRKEVRAAATATAAHSDKALIAPGA